MVTALASQCELHHRAATHGDAGEGGASVAAGAAIVPLYPITGRPSRPSSPVNTARVAGTTLCSSKSSLPVFLFLLLLLALSLLPSAYLRGLGDRAKFDRAARANAQTPPRGPTATDNAPNRPAAAAAKFVFLVAIEGSGHHFYEALYDLSPSKERLHRLGVANRTVMELHLSLWDTSTNINMKETALLSAPCAIGTVEPNGTSIIESISNQMRSIDAKVRNASLPNPTLIPLNAALVSGPDGMMSYPNFAGGCRYLQYPDLDALYVACDVAGVSCRHIILTRDPYAVVRSTHRRFNNQTSKTRSLQLYTTMLDVILAQLGSHPDRLAVCWEYDIAEDGLGVLLGWDGSDSNDDGTNLTSYRDMYTSLFRGNNMTEKEQLEIIPPNVEVYMSSLVRATERVRKECREILQSHSIYV